ncbi:MAG: leucine-rich repeat protein [Clostridia bacterium]|nr:leucine-rich repeat protein [Clostridia bacterium]
MDGELKKIKKLYGEDFAKLCRSLFPKLLEREGDLLEILTDTFAPSRSLFDAITADDDKKLEFKYFVYNKAGIEEDPAGYQEKTPEELLAEKGYKLYRCESDEDVKSYMKYYQEDELLCTFNDPTRIKYFDIFFAVHEDAENLRREDFTNPQRQDDYGTSVMSLQFSKFDGELSIKNRYNHAVENPDNTFSNDLDSIVPGLRDSFSTHYGIESIVDYSLYSSIVIDGFVKGDDNKLYKCNQSVNLPKGKLYFCENNVLIENGKVIQFDKARYELIDGFLLDKQEKKITDLRNGDDPFVEEFKDVEKIDIEKGDAGSRKIIVTKNDETHFIVTIDKSSAIIGYENNFQTEAKDKFLYNCKRLQSLRMDNVEKIGDSFLAKNKDLKELSLPKLREVGIGFLKANNELCKLSLPELKTAGRMFLQSNYCLEELSLPKLETIHAGALSWNKRLSKLNLPELVFVGHDFLYSNEGLESVSLPKAQTITSGFLMKNKAIRTCDLPEVEKIERDFLFSNEKMKTISLPKAKSIGTNFLNKNKILESVDLPEVTTIGACFLNENLEMENISLPKVQKIGSGFMKNNKGLKEIHLPELTGVEDTFLAENTALESLSLPKLEYAGGYFLCKNADIKKLDIQKIESVGYKFLDSVQNLEYANVAQVQGLSEYLKTFLQNQAAKGE